MSTYYILVGRETMPATIRQWAEWGERGDCEWAVRRDTVGEYEISTVFLGLNRNWGAGPPILFETMIFGPYRSEHDMRQWYYSTWDEAERGHAAAMREVAGGNREDDSGMA